MSDAVVTTRVDFSETGAGKLLVSAVAHAKGPFLPRRWRSNSMKSAYRLGESLARTARHAVNLATREATGEKVVLKRSLRDYPLPEDVLRLEFERHLLDKLRGPGIIELLGFERAAGSPVLVLEDFDARSLADGALPLSLADFFALAVGTVEAVSRVHAAQVIHKDLKPSNVLWNREAGIVKLIDFQLSVELSRERRDLNAAAELNGSLPYMSPEQPGRMNRALDYRSDYYSLGVTSTMLRLIPASLASHTCGAMA